MRNFVFLFLVVLVTFLLFLANLFVLGVILTCLLAVIADRILKVSNANLSSRYSIVLLMGLSALISYVLIIFLELFVTIGIGSFTYLHPFVIWSLITTIILRVFTNVVLFPFFVYASRLVSSKNVKSALLVSLLTLSVVSVIWQANYRTIPPEYELVSFHESIADSIENEVNYFSFRGFLLRPFLLCIESVKVITLQHPLLLYTLADIYLVQVIGVWQSFDHNYVLIITGAGVFVLNYYTETGKRLVKESFSAHRTSIQYNGTSLKTSKIIYGKIIDGFWAGNVTLEYNLFNYTNKGTLYVNYNCSILIRKLLLNGGIDVSIAKFFLISQEIIYFREYEVLWILHYKAEELTIYVWHAIYADAVTFLEFYKYEMMLLGIILIGLILTFSSSEKRRQSPKMVH